MYNWTAAYLAGPFRAEEDAVRLRQEARGLLTFLAGVFVGLLVGCTIGVLTMAALAASSRNQDS